MKTGNILRKSCSDPGLYRLDNLQQKQITPQIDIQIPKKSPFILAKAQIQNELVRLLIQEKRLQENTTSTLYSQTSNSDSDKIQPELPCFVSVDYDLEAIKTDYSTMDSYTTEVSLENPPSWFVGGSDTPA